MPDPAPTQRRQRALLAKVAAYAAAYLAVIYSAAPIQRLADRVHDAWWAGGLTWDRSTTLHVTLDWLGHGLMAFFPVAFLAVFAASLVLGPAGLLVRSVARARVAAGRGDPIARARRWVADHPGWVRALTAAPAVVCSLAVVRHGDGPWGGGLDQLEGYQKLGVAATYGLVGVLATVVLTALTRGGVRSFVAPIDDDVAPQRAEIAKDEIAFDAVALTRETRAAVAAMFVLNAAALTLALLSKRTFSDPRILASLLAYAAVALGGAALFRRASRVAIGVDGVLVKGTSRTRFFAYRDLDAARVDGADLELVRGNEVVLRLQLHGEDATKRSGVLARIRDAIDRVKEGRGAVSAQLVSAATIEQLARAASGGADYRGAALTREQLWALVEGPEIEASARQIAAEALARTSDEADLVRLRVAAEQCAAPEVRVAIEKLAEREALEDGADVARADRARQRSAI